MTNFQCYMVRARWLLSGVLRRLAVPGAAVTSSRVLADSVLVAGSVLGPGVVHVANATMIDAPFIVLEWSVSGSCRAAHVGVLLGRMSRPMDLLDLFDLR